MAKWNELVCEWLGVIAMIVIADSPRITWARGLILLNLGDSDLPCKVDRIVQALQGDQLFLTR